MKVEIDFRPIDGPRETLFADLSLQEFDNLNNAINGPDPANTILTIRSRVQADGQALNRVFRASRTTLRKV